MRNTRLALAGMSTLLTATIILPAFAQSSSSSSSSASSESSSSVSSSSSSSVSSSVSSSSSSSSSSGQTYAQCVIAALNARSSAWIAANATYNAALTAAINQLNADLAAAVNAGQGLSKGPAWAAYNQAVNTAAQALKASHREANAQFNTAVKACGQLPGAPTVNMKKKEQGLLERAAAKIMKLQGKIMKIENKVEDKMMKKDQ